MRHTATRCRRTTPVPSLLPACRIEWIRRPMSGVVIACDRRLVLARFRAHVERPVHDLVAPRRRRAAARAGGVSHPMTPPVAPWATLPSRWADRAEYWFLKPSPAAGARSHGWPFTLDDSRPRSATARSARRRPIPATSGVARQDGRGSGGCAAWSGESRRCSRATPGRLKARLRPMRGLKTIPSLRTVAAGHAFVQNRRRGHDEIAVDEPVQDHVRVAFPNSPMLVTTTKSTARATTLPRSINATAPAQRKGWPGYVDSLPDSLSQDVDTPSGCQAGQDPGTGRISRSARPAGTTAAVRGGRARPCRSRRCGSVRESHARDHEEPAAHNLCSINGPGG
jgi:hypothetical protein